MTLLDIAIEDQTLRPYQYESKLEIYKAWEHSPSIMFQMPTGTGKTRLFSSIIKDIQKLSVKTREKIGVLVLVHRTELIEQIHDTLIFKYGVSHGIIKSGYEEDATMAVQVASVQSLTRRIEQWKNKSFSYIIIDEAHHALAKTYRKVCEAYRGARVLGVTATPYRLSGESFRDLFGKLIVSQSVSKFIEQGYLSQYNYYSIKPSSSIQHEIDEINEFGSDGDYSEAALIRVCDKDHIRAELVKSYKQYALGKKGIIYTINCAHNEHVCSEFKKIGLRVVAIDGKTPNEKRKQYVSDFRAGNIDIICNVNIFSEGFDCPDIEFIQLARPTLSLALYLQQVGRALRPHARKNEAVIIDNVGLYNRFGVPSANRQWKRHFEGKASAKEEQKKQKAAKLITNHRSQDFDEGDEMLELIYSCSTDSSKENYSIAACEPIDIKTLSDLYFKSEIFPIGLKRYIRDIENNEEIRQFDEDNPDASIQERRDYISKIESLNRLVDNITRYESQQFNTIDEWIDELESAVIFNDFDSDELIEDYKESIRKFKYKGKYGIGKRKDDCLNVVKTEHGIIRSMKSDLTTLNDIFDILLEPIFDEIDIPNSAGVIRCIKEGKAGVIDEYSRTEVVPFKFDEIDEVVNRETFVVRNGDFYGLYLKGELKLKAEYNLICSQHIERVYAPTTFIVLKDHKYGYYNTENNNNECIWNVKARIQLNERYYLADSPHNDFWFIATKDGHIVFPHLVNSIAVTDNPRIPLVIYYNKQNKIYLSNELEILTPETKEDRIEIAALSFVDKYLNGKQEPKKKKKNKDKDSNGKAVIEQLADKQESEKVKTITQSIEYTQPHAENKGAKADEEEYDKITHLHSSFYKFCRDHKWGILTMLNQKVVKVILEPNYRKICKYENSKKLHLVTLEDFSNRYVYLDGLSLKLETEKIKTKYKSHQILVTATDSELHIYMDGIEKLKIQANEIEVLYDGVFKFKQNDLWGILKITLDDRIKIAKEAIFEDIEIHNASNNQFLGQIKGKRPRLFTL